MKCYHLQAASSCLGQYADPIPHFDITEGLKPNLHPTKKLRNSIISQFLRACHPFFCAIMWAVIFRQISSGMSSCKRPYGTIVCGAQCETWVRCLLILGRNNCSWQATRFPGIARPSKPQEGRNNWPWPWSPRRST